ncbi:MAG: hypothetical protein SFV18_03410 [Bryobacteraceae bacterium]|nr:hypothetical protein [Bryobacteraceae bacterium]
MNRRQPSGKPNGPASNAEKSIRPLDPERIAAAKETLMRAIEAYDRDGDEGLERELDRLYPAPNIVEEVTLPCGATIRAWRRSDKKPLV